VAHRTVRTIITALALAGAGGLGACSIDKEADAAARQFNDEVRTGANLAGDPHVGPQLTAADAAAALAAFHAALPTDAPSAVKNTGFSFNSDNTGATYSLTYEYDFAGGRQVMMTDTMQKLTGQTTWTIIGFKGEPGGGAPTDTAGAPPPSSNASGSGS
jgi:hypothetical protein